jgi:clan AA aspartic protease (TIGR02281 family)
MRGSDPDGSRIGRRGDTRLNKSSILIVAALIVAALPARPAEYWADPKMCEDSILPPSLQRCGDQPQPQPVQPASNNAGGIPLSVQGGTFLVPVLINGQITLNFTIDSGAADVSIPADVVSTLIRTGTLQKSDFVGQKTYRLADGSTVPSATFLIRSLKVGNRLLENVTGNVASAKADLLLGQSFLNRFNSWSIDNKRQVLLLN